VTPPSRLSYAVITPARNEADNLRRLAESLAAQIHAPERWIVVDDGSTDETRAWVGRLAAGRADVELVKAESAGNLDRGGRTVAAFAAGRERLDRLPDVVVKLDADITVAPDYFADLLCRFEDDATLGIASGRALELENGEWREQFLTGDNVWGAARAYRRECLELIEPFERHTGWDGVDTLKAHAHGWRTATFHDLYFRHHRLEGARHASRWGYWTEQGRMAYFMGYRPSYLLLRSLRRLLREPAALALVPAYARSAWASAPRCSDPAVLSELRGRQQLRKLPLRLLESIGRQIAS
jgi:biofilm PGA synthesis N-glycosyltransferase PgaC